MFLPFYDLVKDRTVDGGTLPQARKVVFLQKEFVKIVLPLPRASSCGTYPQL